eukprot:scaffold3799_cov162-Amphora_coffeaeformis.AAC.2
MAGKGMELMEILGCEDGVFYPKMSQQKVFIHQLHRETPYKPPRRCIGCATEAGRSPIVADFLRQLLEVQMFSSFSWQIQLNAVVFQPGLV